MKARVRRLAACAGAAVTAVLLAAQHPAGSRQLLGVLLLALAFSCFTCLAVAALFWRHGHLRQPARTVQPGRAAGPSGSCQPARCVCGEPAGTAIEGRPACIQCAGSRPEPTAARPADYARMLAPDSIGRPPGAELVSPPGPEMAEFENDLASPPS